MPVTALSIVKSTQYQGGVREFGNTYHYVTGADAGVANDNQLAAQVVAAERAITSSQVTFVRWQTWGPTDGPEFDNVMRADGVLTGPGGVSGPAELYKEACALVVWPMERSPVTNRKRWLRKFLRLGIGAGVPADGVMSGASPLSDAARAAFANYAAEVLQIEGGSVIWSLCSEDGTEPIDAGLVRPYLSTRQIGR